MKALRWTLSFLVAAVMATGLQTEAFATSGKEAAPVPPKVNPVDGQVVPYQIESLDNLPSEVKSEVNRFKQKQISGFTPVKIGGKTYVILSLGLRPTSGYDLELLQAIRHGSSILIWTREIRPSEDEFVAPVLTTPVKVISFKGQGQSDFYWVWSE
ncbi:protease complex subunit PrcB family protein [Salinithrix halophila]|uniref:Protease complex subunit PrcB family protein n=1 Tax=Salinithrix halophila TaxID=1485204 RepID=A0ABV8JDR0_9BACL